MAVAPLLGDGIVMRILFVVHRYGIEVRGGAEGACRELATRLAARGHDVTVLTTRALGYRTWEPHYASGEEVLDGVRVVRLENRVRDVEAFDRLHLRIERADDPIATPLQAAWIEAQGPVVPDLPGWFADHAPEHDVAVFLPYLYGTTTTGLPAASGRIPTVLVPCLHPEPPLRLHAFDEVADLADLVAFLTPEEALLFRERFRPRARSLVAGLGVDDHDHEPSAALPPEVGDKPFVLYLGRIDPSKGTDWLVDAFAQHRRRSPHDLRLVMAGDPVVTPPATDGVILTGIVDDATRTALLRSARALVHPSPFESFSLVVMEAWSERTPVLATRSNDVLRGHLDRSGGGIGFDDANELSAALDLLTEDIGLRDRLGIAGRLYVDRDHRWEAVLDRWERALRRATNSGVGLR